MTVAEGGRRPLQHFERAAGRRKGAFELGEIGRAQSQVERGSVLAHMRRIGGLRDPVAPAPMQEVEVETVGVEPC
jgi:hypothetical protein